MMSETSEFLNSERKFNDVVRNTIRYINDGTRNDIFYNIVWGLGYRSLRRNRGDTLMSHYLVRTFINLFLDGPFLLTTYCTCLGSSKFLDGKIYQEAVYNNMNILLHSAHAWPGSQ